MARGFLLHGRPYRETSLISTFITDVEGRTDLLVRSARNGRQRKQAPLMPFCQYELSWTGRSELRHMQYAEPAAPAISLSGRALYCGFYLNELLYRLLPLHEPEHRLLACYADSLEQLSVCGDLEPVLRCFELQLLDCLGYGLDFFCDENGQALQEAEQYMFVPEKGTVIATGRSERWPVGSGGDFSAIAQRDFSRQSVRQLAKAVMRTALAVYLDHRPLRSRELFLQ